MTTKMSEVTIDRKDGSIIESPEWQTSGITSGSQVLPGTAGLSFWTGESSTAVEGINEYVSIIEVGGEDISKLLLADEQFRESIERAKEEMRRGEPFLSHKDVFGE